ncbi:MAG TPA: amidohydrolase family protein [Candidatus Limnocylindria bacterium]|nr:amidohydrolase family protein [Candidatus Limnocylindria bacterium]
MWIRKFQRDRKKGVDSAMPTQVLSNEEFIPRPQSRKQKEVEFYIGQMAEEKSRKLGMDRRTFMASAMGMATCFLASNKVWGKVWDVTEAETFDPAAYQEKLPKGEFFVLDVQTHFTNGIALNFRSNEFVKNMGFNLKDDVESYSFSQFLKEIFFDSETEMIVISGVPGPPEKIKDDTGKVLEGSARAGGILPSWLMAQSRDKINKFAGSRRALSQGNLAPNHYWDHAKNAIDKEKTIAQMERELSEYKINSWKWYCHADPGRSGHGFQLDDDDAAWFYQESRKRGLKIFSVHKGYSYQSRLLGHLANPKDVEKAALNNPDLTFIIYHSAIQHAPSEPEWAGSVDPTTGDFAWHNVLMDIKKRNPKMNNVYPEVGSFFNVLAIADPNLCMHGMGKNIKIYGADHVIWGTDCLWWGSPQWAIEAFKRFQISDELCEKFGYSKITKEDKAKIFGLNAARIYGVDVKEKRNPLSPDIIAKAREAYPQTGMLRENAAYGWVRADD